MSVVPIVSSNETVDGHDSQNVKLSLEPRNLTSTVQCVNHVSLSLDIMPPSEMLSHPIAQKTINSVQNDWDRLPRYIHDALVFILELLPLGFLAS